MNNRPRGRVKNVTGQGKSVYKRGSGLGTGPVGKPGGHTNRPTYSNPNPSSSGSSGSAPQRATRGGKAPILIIAIVAIVAIFFGGKFSGLFGGGGGGSSTPSQPISYPSASSGSNSASSLSSLGGLGDLSSLFGSFGTTPTGSVSTGWDYGSNQSTLNRNVDPAARARYTKPVGNGNDKVNIMVYMCGTDLESKSGMATADLTEMANATIGSNVNLIVCTGGCKQWKTNGISNRVNQIYKVEGGGIKCLVSDFGSDAMTKPANLTKFISWCNSNYPGATRNMLIFWDHGGGSLSGYGYDEKNPNSGSMTLKGINEALKNANTKFDVIGFDACLMATLENALMLTDYADYLIASEETEPGVGWYYTNWLTALSKNTSMDTLDIGKQIVDDFVDVCAQRCNGQKTTLSVIDLAELQNTAPDALKDFAQGTTELLTNDQYQAVSDARNGAREFSPSSKIDQVDLVHLARNLDTAEGKELAETLLSAVKYNRTSTNMSNAYGVSIYFPYRKTSGVNNAVATYEAIGLDSEYARCIQQFASLEVGGQSAAGTTSPLGSLLGGFGGGSAAASGSDAISSMLSGLLGGGDLFGRSLNVDSAADYLAENQFDASQLVWTNGSDGTKQIYLPEDQWSLVNDVELNVFFDDGEGYIDLGLDNVFDFTDDGCLVSAFDGTWLAINDQPVPYYHIDTIDDGENYTITGRVPCLLNGDRADLILVFDNDHPYGYIAGARRDYKDGETDTIAKGMLGLYQGDIIDFVCDYYSYDGEYLDSYLMGDQMIVEGAMNISNVYLEEGRANATYLFTDIYCQEYWTPVID